MTAEDELALPQVPEAKPEDPEDVSWALSTAEAMWARGDHLEGIKWVRKAAEAASDVEDDNRALELAKIASDLTTALSRRSSGPALPGNAPPVPAARSVPPARSQPPQPPPVPAKSSQPPRVSQAPQAFQPPRASPRPPATADARQAPQVGKGILTHRGVPPSPPSSSSSLPGNAPKARRRSRENLDTEARAAGVIETAPRRALDKDAAAQMLAHAEPDPTIVGRFEDLEAERRRALSAAETSRGTNLSGGEANHDLDNGDRQTAFQVQAAPAAPSVTPSVRPPQVPLHDPGIQTSQAVRVVVWRDASGVHVAPAGTVVSAITIDAVLVVLEPSADLTAWLSQRER